MKDIILHIEGRKILAVLNDTVAARDFATRLPFRTSGFDSGVDYCCVAEEGKSDPKERQAGWKNGDINLAGGWFALLYGGEEESQSYKDLMIIGRLKDVNDLKGLPKTIEITVTLAEQSKEEEQ